MPFIAQVQRVPLTHSPSPHLHLVRRESRTVSSAMPVYLDSADSVWVEAGWEVMIERPREDSYHVMSDIGKHLI